MRTDPMTDDLEALLGSDYRKSSTAQEQRERIEEILDFKHYVRRDPKPSDATTTMTNPAVEGYRKYGLQWSSDGWVDVDTPCSCALQEYPEYVPTDEAINVLIDYGPLVEVGAGNGYWSYVLNENGGDAVPTDICPIEVHSGTYPVTETFETNGGETEEPRVRLWCNVETQDGKVAVTEHPDRTVLMCHPSGATRWSEDVLDAITDQHLVFVGEWFPGADATIRFFQKLIDEFTLIETFPVFDWESMHAQGYVFTKKSHSR